jgi:hypothetical protein
LTSNIAHLAHCAELHAKGLSEIIRLVLDSSVAISSPGSSVTAPLPAEATLPNTHSATLDQLVQALPPNEPFCLFCGDSGDTLTVIASRGIVNFSPSHPLIDQIAHFLGRFDYVVFGGPTVQPEALHLLHLDPNKMYSPNIFATTAFITNVTNRPGWTPTAIICEYLIGMSFFGTTVATPACQCPLCDVSAPSHLDLYRHLYRNHNPFPAYVMNRMKASGTVAGVLRCSQPACVWEGDTYEKLIQHVYESHRLILLNATLGDIDAFVQKGDLGSWIREELRRMGHAPEDMTRSYSHARPPPPFMQMSELSTSTPPAPGYPVRSQPYGGRTSAERQPYSAQPPPPPARAPPYGYGAEPQAPRAPQYGYGGEAQGMGYGAEAPQAPQAAQGGFGGGGYDNRTGMPTYAARPPPTPVAFQQYKAQNPDYDDQMYTTPPNSDRSRDRQGFA